MSASIAFTYVAGIIVTTSERYFANDNLGIALNVREGFLVRFIPALSGFFLSFLYRRVAFTVPWFGIALYTAHTAALYLVIRLVIRWHTNRPVKLTVLLLFLVYYGDFIIRTGYNSASICLGSAGIISFIASLCLEKRPPGALTAALFGVAFASSYLFRKDGLLAVILLAAPAFALCAAYHGKKNTILFAAFLTPLPMMWALNTALETMALPAEQREFLLFDLHRGKFHGFPLEELNRDNNPLLEANRWTETDYAMLSGWLFLDENKFNSETLANVAKYSVPLVEGRLKAQKILGRMNVLQKRFRYELLLLGTLALLALLSPDRRKLALLAVYGGYLLLLVGYLAVFRRFPARIATPMLFCAGLYLFLIASHPYGRHSLAGNRIVRLLLLFVLLAVAATTARTELGYLCRIEKVAGARTAKFKEVSDRLLTDYADKLLLIEAGSGLGRVSPSPLARHHYEDKLRVIPTGWQIYSPRFYHRIRQYGMQMARDIFPTMIDNPDACLIIHPDSKEMVRTYLGETYGGSFALIEADTLNTNSVAYVIRHVTEQSRKIVEPSSGPSRQ